MSSFIPNKMNFDDSEPPCFDRKIQNSIKYKNQIYKDAPDLKSNYNFQFHIRSNQDFINIKINQAKRKYYKNMSHTLSDKSLIPKKYWSLLKTLNDKKYLIYHQIDTNRYFPGQCTS